MVMNNLVYPLRFPLIQVGRQTIGVFYAASIPASLLCKVAFSVKAIYSEGALTGTQRKIKEERTSLIADYIDSKNCAFPNSVILGANFTESGDYIDSLKSQWSVETEELDNGMKSYTLVIPSEEKAVSIIDGQHRLDGFRKHFSRKGSPTDMDLLCSIFFDTPSPVQAEIFATINYNQKPVDKSLAYQLFGYSLDKKSSTEWEPDNLALHIARIFDKEEDSPFYGMIKSGAIEKGMPRESRHGFILSTAAIVEGVVKLFSSNPIKDRYKINKKSLFEKGRDRIKNERSSAPLRKLYIQNQDRKIYDIVSNFFEVVMDEIVSPSVDDSKIRSTIGILALFDLLKHVLQCQKELEASKGYFSNLIKPCEQIDFSNEYFSAAGIGRGRIRNALMMALEIDSDHHRKVIDRIKPKTKDAINKIIFKY